MPLGRAELGGARLSSGDAVSSQPDGEFAAKKLLAVLQGDP